jgi:hypothetical protein
MRDARVPDGSVAAREFLRRDGEASCSGQVNELVGVEQGVAKVGPDVCT